MDCFNLTSKREYSSSYNVVRFQTITSCKQFITARIIAYLKVKGQPLKDYNDSKFEWGLTLLWSFRTQLFYQGSTQVLELGPHKEREKLWPGWGVNPRPSGEITAAPPTELQGQNRSRCEIFLWLFCTRRKKTQANSRPYWSLRPFLKKLLLGISTQLKLATYNSLILRLPFSSPSFPALCRVFSILLPELSCEMFLCAASVDRSKEEQSAGYEKPATKWPEQAIYLS